MMVRVPLSAHVLTELNVESPIIGKWEIIRSRRFTSGLPVILPELDNVALFSLEVLETI
jgi:hypothetical protein